MNGTLWSIQNRVRMREWVRRSSVLFLAILLFAPARLSALTLQEGLGIVSEKSRDVSIAREAEAQAQEGVSLARSPLFPWVDVFANHTWLRYEPRAKFGSGTEIPLSEKDYFSYGFSANQLIYDFGKTYSGIRASKHFLTLRQTDVFRVKNGAALEFIVAFLDLLESEKMVIVDRKEVERLNAHLRDTQALYAEGMITRNDVLQAEVVLSDAQQRLLTAENLRAVRASRVNSLLLRPLNEEFSPEEVGLNPSPEMKLDDAWQTAEQDRPEIREADSAIKAKEEEQKTARAEFFPTLYLSGGYQYEENRNMVHEDNWSVLAGMNINLSSGGATVAKMRRADAEIRELRINREKLLDAIRIEVKNSYLELESARKRVDVTEKAVAQAEENLRLQRLRYQEGVGTATDVLDASALMTRAESNYWSGIYGVKRAEARLHHSIGRNLHGIYGQ